MRSRTELHPALAGSFLLMLLVFSLIVVGLISDPVEEANNELKEYCAGVEAFIESGGDYGWPDYKGDYIPHCTELATEK